MNLTTPVDELVFNHDSQILAMSSRLKKDAVKMVSLLLAAVLACVRV